MSKGVFHSTNKVGQVFSIQTNVTSGSTFDPTITFLTGSDRVSWDLGNGKLIAGNSLIYTFTGDTGTTKTIKLKTNRVSKLKQFQSNNDNIVGRLDMSKWSSLGGNFFIFNNPNLTGITHTYSPQTFTNYFANNCDLRDNHNLSMLSNLGGNFNISFNNNLTGITHTASTQVFTQYFANNCDLRGNHDLSMFPNLGGNFQIHNNSGVTLNDIGLTGITHTASTQVFIAYFAYKCDLRGNHDLSMFPNLGGIFTINNNPNLTGITHTASTQVFTQYVANNCDLRGNHDLSMFPNLGSNFNISFNNSLTGITHTASTQVFTQYFANNCDLRGNHDVSMFPNLSVYFDVSYNPNLTGITHTASTKIFTQYKANNCPNLRYINFKVFSGATFNNSEIMLYDNTMSSADVNHILDDFKIITVANPSKWTGISLDIGGSNQNPDTSSGGYNGLGAISTLTGSPYNWLISY